MPPVRNQGARSLVDRNRQRADLEPFQPAVAPRHVALRREAGLDLGKLAGLQREVRTHHRQGQGLVIRALELQQHRHAPRHAVVVDFRVEMAGSGGVLLIDRQVSGVALPLQEADVAAGERSPRNHRIRDGVDPDGIVLGVEVIAQDHRAALDRRREQAVVVELFPQVAVDLLKRRDRLQILLRQRVEHVDPGARIALRPDHVEAEDPDAVLVEQLVDQLGHQPAAPRPAADLAEALLVDVEDDDAGVDPARHGEAQPRVVDDVVDLGDEPDLVESGGVPDEEQRDREA